MIHRVILNNFRESCTGTLEGLALLTILVGPNGGGKSTFLYALRDSYCSQLAEVRTVRDSSRGDRIGVDIWHEEGTDQLRADWCAHIRSLAGPKSLILLDGPEINQHPRSLGERAKTIWECVRLGSQVVLATHSLDLIDRLLFECTKHDVEGRQSEVEMMAVCRLDRRDGKQSQLWERGEEIRHARLEVDMDLR